MDRQELSRILFPPQSTSTKPQPSVFPSRSSSHRPYPQSQSFSQPPSPLSPRQRFQSHVRALSENSPTSTSTASNSPSRSYSRPLPVPSQTKPTQDEPHFITEEREAWSRTSPFAKRSRSVQPQQDLFILRPPEQESPIIQPRKQLRSFKPFAPLPQSPDLNDRPKTSRGEDPGFTSFHVQNHSKTHDSRFAEGSMSSRSTGVSSTWHQHSAACTSSEVDTDIDLTPKPSPQRSSLDIDDFTPAVVTPGTLKQRLAKFGSTFKSHQTSISTKQSDPPEPQNGKKKRGLRKSISMWSIPSIGSKINPFSASTNDLTPKAQQKDNPGFSDVQVLNDRKRRAEEAYAQQFGSKRRKSQSGIPGPTTESESEALPLDRSSSKHRLSTSRSTRRLSLSSSSMTMTDNDLSESHSDVDQRKRPSRRELEKENQQLRAMLKEQQASNSRKTAKRVFVEQNKPNIVHELPSVDSAIAVNDNSGNKKTPSKKKASKILSKDIPPVPIIPDRVALTPLTNANNQPRHSNVKASNNNLNVNDIPVSTSTTDVNPVKRNAPTVGRSRPVSTILEEDESNMENRTPLKLMTSDDLSKLKQLTPTPVRISGLRREQWEWPDDVF